jgi:DNA-binding SARP family transcriptional activator/TolB-like protein
VHRLPIDTGIMFSLKLFGGVSLCGEDGPLSGPAAQRRRLALLSLLATAPEAGVSREKLIGYLWPDTGSEQARRFLADSVYALRKALGQEAILAQGDSLRLSAVIRSDVGEFREALARSDRQAAVALHQGPFLDGFFVPDAPELERWAEVERERCARDVALALEALAEEREREGDLRGAVEWWRRLATHDPYSSHVALRLMQALEASGDRAGALQHARVHEALLREMLEVEPDAEVIALAERLRSPGAGPRGASGRSSPQPRSLAPSHPQAAPSPPGEAERSAEGVRQEPADRPPGGPDQTAPPRSSTTRSAAGRAWARRPRPGMAWAAALLLVMGGVGAAVFVRGTPAPDSRRVFVAIFDNQTGDPALNPLGRMAADWIARGLLQTESLEVVYPPTILEGEGDPGTRTLARAAGAGTVVSGAYYLEGGVLRLQAQITDMVRGRLLQTLEPLSVPVDSATIGVELLRQQVAAALAARFDWSQELREITTRSQPPTYAAYGAYVEGIELFGLNLQQAIERFDRAWKLDTSFYPARLFSILAQTQVGNLAVADSMIQGLAPHWDTLTPFERAFLERSRADLAGDRGTALRAARRMAELAPGSQFIMGHAAQAVWANHPREAVEALRQLDPKLGLIPGYAREEFLTTARHMLGEHRRELQGARQSRIQHPDLRSAALASSTQPYLRGAHTLWRARIAAQLGQRDRAQHLLREALAQGQPHGLWMHTDQDLEAPPHLRR